MNSLDYFFEPKSIAIIGASHSTGKIGHVILQNLISAGFKGEIFPINPKKGTIIGKQVFASIKEIKTEIDLAIIAIPGALVPKALKECGERKVKAAIIISAGFGEIGNIKLAQELQKVMDKYSFMKIVGPNCLGVMHMKNGVDSLFLPAYRLERPKHGEISFISQSGALGSAILDWASFKNYGINKFVSYGNAMQVDEADLLEYLGKDDSTKVIAVYLEGVRNGKKFFKILRKVTQKKPVIVIKGGITAGGAKATKSHTGSLAGSSEVFKAMLKQANAIHATTLEEVFDFARTFVREPQMKNNRIQIITNGGGYGVLSADALSMNGLQLAKMEEKTRKEILKGVPSYAIIDNPMDLTGDADNKRYEVALNNISIDKNVDAILLILLFQVPTLDSDIIETVQAIKEETGKPLFVISAGGNYSETHRMALEKSNINTFISPFDAAKCFKELFEYYKNRTK